MAQIVGGPRWLMRAAAAVLLIAGSSLALSAQGPSEYQVKAAYLYSFGKFIEWPAAAPVASDAFVVCVLGADPFGKLLDDVAANGVMKDRPVRVQRIAAVEESAPCHTLFISGSKDVEVANILTALNGRAVLTVSDAPQFAQRGGMIGFAVEASRVRFTVNLTAAQAAGLTMNSELLRVAARVLRGK